MLNKKFNCENFFVFFIYEYEKMLKIQTFLTQIKTILYQRMPLKNISTIENSLLLF